MRGNRGRLYARANQGDMTQQIVFLDRASIEARLRAPAFAHRWTNHAATAPAEVVPRLQGASVAVVNKVVLDAAVLAQLPRLRLIALCATGSDNIDLDYCRDRGIAVANIRGYAVHTVPEHVFMLMLALRRRLPAYHADVRAGRWQTAAQFCFFDHPIRDLHGATLGIVGFGALGQAVATLATAFGMSVLIAEHKGRAPRAGFVAFESVLAQADVLSLHAPLTQETQHLIGAPELARMRADAILINCGRGGLVDETALAAALRAGRLGGAGIDVLSAEPPGDGNPLLAHDLPNLIVTPHIAWASREAMQTMADQLIDNIEAFFAGQARNRLV